MSSLTALFGEGRDLTALQMMLRGLVVFLIALTLIRVSGRRSFGQHSPFDSCITVLLGAILSRGIVGASPFLPVIATGIVLVLLHRGLAMLSVRHSAIERLLSGSPTVLFDGGHLSLAAMRRGLVSQTDMRQAVREHAQAEGLQAVKTVTLEHNGIITVVKHGSG
jgi:uncharacterized membrane protein YcaP (DUF421 family)